MIPYATIDEADAYFESRLNTEDWDDASDVEKLKALNMATRAINKLRFRGEKTLDSQDNQFPRTYIRILATGTEVTTYLGSYGTDGLPTYPSWLIEATCEIAINMLDGTDMEQEAENLIATGQTYAGVSTAYNPQLVSEHMRAGIPSIEAWNLLQPHLINIRTIKLSRG